MKNLTAHGEKELITEAEKDKKSGMILLKSWVGIQIPKSNVTHQKSPNEKVESNFMMISGIMTEMTDTRGLGTEGGQVHREGVDTATNTMRIVDMGTDTNVRTVKTAGHLDTEEGKGTPKLAEVKIVSYVHSSTDSEEMVRKPNKKSGISAKPTSGVQQQLTYPHFSLGQYSGFISQNLQYHQLNFEQFIAGEMLTIMSTEDNREREGRIELLQKISIMEIALQRHLGAN